MTLPVPDIDDKRFDQLVDEMLAAIPVYDPSWTDYNATDPGITLVELFAWLADMLVYRANRIAPAQTETFLRLINGPCWKRNPCLSLADEVRCSVHALWREERAVTAADYERLIKEFYLLAKPSERIQRIARAMCLPLHDIDAAPRKKREEEALGVVSNVVLSGEPFAAIEVTHAAISDGLPIALPSATGDSLTVGLARQFGAIAFSLDQPGSGYGLKFQYSADAAPGGWADFTPGFTTGLVDYTFGWMQSGAVVFQAPAGWTKSDGKYRVRIKCVKKPAIAATAAWIAPRNAAIEKTLCDAIAADLGRRRLLGTRNVVGDPWWALVTPDIKVCAEPDQPVETVRARVCGALRDFLDPWTGGADGAGWPLGRAIYLSDLYAILVGVAGVRQVLNIHVSSGPWPEPWKAPPDRSEAGVPRHAPGDVEIGLEIADDQLPMALFDPARVVVAYTVDSSANDVQPRAAP